MRVATFYGAVLKPLMLDNWDLVTLNVIVVFLLFLLFSIFPWAIDDYAKDGGPEVVWRYVVFTKILCGRNFCVWYVTELKFTEQLQMASLSLYPQFETNLMSNRKVIEFFLQLKSAKAHGKTT